jgi:hypothetical protein
MTHTHTEPGGTPSRRGGYGGVCRPGAVVVPSPHHHIPKTRVTLTGILYDSQDIFEGFIGCGFAYG